MSAEASGLLHIFRGRGMAAGYPRRLRLRTCYPAAVAKEKSRPSDDPELAALRERAEAIRLKSGELIRQMHELAERLAREKERAMDQRAKWPRI
jgi:hypothetical protein